jgi:hypothetical protein
MTDCSAKNSSLATTKFIRFGGINVTKQTSLQNSLIVDADLNSVAWNRSSYALLLYAAGPENKLAVQHTPGLNYYAYCTLGLHDNSLSLLTTFYLPPETSFCPK